MTQRNGSEAEHRKPWVPSLTPERKIKLFRWQGVSEGAVSLLLMPLLVPALQGVEWEEETQEGVFLGGV